MSSYEGLMPAVILVLGLLALGLFVGALAIEIALWRHERSRWRELACGYERQRRAGTDGLTKADSIAGWWAREDEKRLERLAAAARGQEVNPDGTKPAKGQRAGHMNWEW